ncbi:hypothetical protein GXW78_02520 [Roseomonas terrae]|uniref:2'-5' RNA ligase n=1 Tax=Neoroseomonas terrae TaxID=424799 RepID=A0ABS5EBX9_9PROT|nr:2'-5' RNA ligase family protein [Neoroseomonas terrae]MBR0648523.1 hypothetical protein [Neoroseomonas terrae]
MQQVFDFLPPPPNKAPRLYLGLVMESAVGRRLGDLAGTMTRHAVGWNCTRVGSHHLSLHFLRHGARPPERLIHAVERAAGQIRTPAFEMSCGEAACIRTPSAAPDPFRLILRAESEALAPLHQELMGGLIRQGRKARPDFAPHITLGRGATALTVQAIDPVRIAVQEVALILSGEEYRILRRFPLAV